MSSAHFIAMVKGNTPLPSLLPSVSHDSSIPMRKFCLSLLTACPHLVEICNSFSRDCVSDYTLSHTQQYQPKKLRLP